MSLLWAKLSNNGQKMTDITIGQQDANAPIKRFLVHRDSIILFLALTVAFTILLVVFGQPTSLTQFTSQRTTLTPLGQIALCFTTGLAFLIVSRILLFFLSKRQWFQTAAYFIWLITELLLCVSIMTLVFWALSGGGPVELAPLVGDLSLGYVSIQIVPYVISYLVFLLNESKRDLRNMRQLLEKQGIGAQSSTDSIINFFNKSNHLALSTKSSNVLYIEAADNYVNIHYINDGKEDTLILLNSMKNIEKNFSGTSFMRCHRGYMVNVENVRLMRKDNLGLVLELNHTSKVIPVSKSFAEPITKYFAYNTSMTLPNE